LQWLVRCTCLWLLAPVLAQAGSAPYASLYHALEPGLKLKDFPRLKAVQRIQSKLARVRPDQISVRILTGGGSIDVPITADGQIRFPLEDRLLSENPAVESNQPSGSLSLSVSFEVVPPAQVALPYGEFIDSVRQAQAALRQLDNEYAQAEVVGVEYRMAQADASVTVESPNGEDLLRADAKGRIIVRMDPLLDSARTRIRFSALPTQAFPNLRMPR
jgi:hypothetical protein